MTSKKILTTWQKKQAALLYFFASDEYLKGLQERVRALQTFVDEILDKSRDEGRDRFLKSSRWGDRDTSENWSNHAWSFLADFGLSVARHMADRASGIYHVTGAYQCGRGMAEFSMQWALPEEEEKFDAMFASITKCAGNIDDTMEKGQIDSRWDDFSLALAWQEHVSKFPQLPKFRIRDDISCKTGDIPPITGVYISSEYPDGALQFAWNGNEYGELLECSIFNDLGRRALADVGRSKLWLDEDAMFEFVRKNANDRQLKEDPFNSEDSTPDLAPSLVARNAFTSAPSKWFYVERLEGEFEDIDTEIDQVERKERRVEAGEHCEMSGFYFSPASPGSRRFFGQGDNFPKLDSTYGNTIWQWDEKQV
ncbi:hypothetical protein [Massilia sp. BSC265]|uniref:hypothetical protein n=1 Tax=Massilia sp. BSC265 TaxID=1549812 RepID=UPI0012698CBB|nr:hypothetical protein [Massilia sp. BSC265]